MIYDALIIGAGAVGCALARELSKYELNTIVLEKDSDVAAGTTGRNSAVVHAGFNNKPGSLMAKFCVKGNQGFEELCKDLDVPYKKTGKLVIALDKDDEAGLDKIFAQGKDNGCRGLRIVGREEIREMVPGVDGYKALYSPETAITNPFLYCIALAENALENGVEFRLNTEVTGIRRTDKGIFAVKAVTANRDADRGRTACHDSQVIDRRANDDGRAAGYTLRTDNRDDEQDKDEQNKGQVSSIGSKQATKRKTYKSEEEFLSRMVINCAGLNADKISAMAGVDKYRLYPCRGEYFLLDKDEAGILPMPVYPVPKATAGGLGVHLTPTCEGNIIIGPSAVYIDANDDYSSTRPVMDRLLRDAKTLMPGISGIQPIGNYAGIRPKLAPPGEGGYRDFVIKEEETCPGLVNLIGIESPGLTASVPIAEYAADIVLAGLSGRGAVNISAKGKSKGKDKDKDKDICITTGAGQKCVGASAGTSAAAGEAVKRYESGREGCGCEDDSRAGFSKIPEKADFKKTRRGIVRFREQPPEVQAELIRQDPEYGDVICRCQTITRSEIRQAIENPLGARSISAIKYRAWPTTGRCNGGYCLPKIIEMLVYEYGMKPEEIKYRGEGSEMLTGFVK